MNLVIKIGTAALSRPDGAPDLVLLGHLTTEIAGLKRAGHDVILVSSGAVGTGKAMVAHNQPLVNCDQVAERQILAALGQARLMALYQDLFAPHQLLVAQILLTKQDFRTRDHHKHIGRLFGNLRAQPHIVPIVNENDSVAISELMFTDNDELAGLIAAMMHVDRLLILSHIAGVYDRPPDELGATIIPTIDWGNKDAAPSTSGKSKAGRGGMTSKLSIARKMAGLGIHTHIASARTPNVIAGILRGEQTGTTILPLPDKRNAVKRWLASEVNMAPASVRAHDKLAKILRDPKQRISILPVGLVAIDGSFEKGDLVRIVDEAGRPLALGVARYGAEKLHGMLEKQQQPVFVHYDQLHLTVAEQEPPN